jgi:OmcA/MtrC family decaheme c-type cytochrome
MSKRLLVLMCSIFLIVPLFFMGCGGSDGSNGSNGATGATGATGANGTNGTNLTATAQPESCAVCHAGAGDTHQANYDQLYQDNVIVVSNLAYAFNATDNTDVVTFNMKKAGTNVDCSKIQNLNIYWAPFDNATGLFEFVPYMDRLSIKGTTATKGTLVGDATTGLCTSTNPSFDNVSFLTENGYVVVYGYDERIGTLPPSRVSQVKYPYAQILKTGTVNFASAANVAGCEKCHIVPFLKHGNIYGQVNHDNTTDFITCKACHLDNGPGGHQFWQELVDNPEMAARDFNGALTTADNAAIAAKYGYKTRLMNDVHMSHAMEFGYPQSMANCATCHAGKLTKVLTDNNFTLETCRSCHPVTGSASAEKTQPALKTILPAAIHGSMDLYNNATGCNVCHKAGGIAPVFSAIHTGYDPIIYTAAGVKYSSIFKVTIDNASFVDNTNKLTFGFSATGTLAGFATTNITPTVLVGLYGWDSKDYLVGPHESYPSTYPDNALKGRRYLEFNAATPTAAGNSAYITVTKTGSTWIATADLSAWASKIKDSSVKRVEIAVMPALLNADNVAVALNAPSRTFDLKSKTFKDTFYSPIVNVLPPAKGPSGGCNNCHDALATTFHTADRGGNIVVCRLCHTVRSGGSHLEMQSRSIDSYAHAIHTFQAFDIGTVQFDNAVQSMFYDLKIESHYPTFDTTNCVSCHVAGAFNVPNQSKSMPGVLSASTYPLKGKTRNIGTVPSYIAGPASRACGACHRAESIKEDNDVDLITFNSHTRTNGYLLENANIDNVTLQVMSNFEETIVLPAP